MSCSLSFQIPKALPSLCQSHCKIPSVSIHSKQKQSHNPKPNKEPTTITGKVISYFNPKKSCLAIQVGALLGTVVQLPAYAVTGVNDEEDIIWVLIQLAISAFFYFLVAPPIIMNWLRIRWYKRNLLEMYFQFMFVFLFFPGAVSLSLPPASATSLPSPPRPAFQKFPLSSFGIVSLFPTATECSWWCPTDDPRRREERGEM